VSIKNFRKYKEEKGENHRHISINRTKIGTKGRRIEESDITN